MSYGVNVTNIYELLSEDGEVQINAPAKQAAKAPAKTSAPPAKQSTKPQTQQTQKPQSTSSTQPARGGSSRPPQNRPPRQQRTTAPASEVTEGGDKGAQKDFERRERKRGTYSSGPQRVYDRRSGTGRGRENKKGGAGRGNWGPDAETTPDSNAEKPTEEKPAEAVEGEKKETEKEEVKHEEEEEEEEKDNTKTFEEYLAEKAAKKPTFALPESRKINAGVDPKELKKWEKYEVLKREFEDEVKEEGEGEVEETTQKKPKKQIVPLNEIFDVRTPPIRTGGRGRGRGRGGFRGGRGGRGGNRGGDRPATEIKIDEQSFPALKPKA